MSGRLYISTFGCQMNEYDSARWPTCCASPRASSSPADPEQADVILLNTCSVREKAQEKVFSHLGRWRHAEARKPGLVIGVGGCVASQEGEGIVERAPFVDLVFGPQTLHRLPEMIAARARRAQPQVDISFPEIEKFDRLPRAARRRRDRVRLDHGRLQQVLQLLRRALYARRGNVPPVRGGRRRGRRRSSRQGVQRSHAARPERERLSRARGGRDGVDLADAHPPHRATSTASSASASRPRIRASSRTR